MASVSVQAIPEVSSVGSHVCQAMPDTSLVGIQVLPDANSVQGSSEAMAMAILQRSVQRSPLQSKHSNPLLQKYQPFYC